MTKRTNKPKATSTVAPTINSTAPTSLTESVKAESKAKVATKGKQANGTAKKAPQITTEVVKKATQPKTQAKRPRTKKVTSVSSPTKDVDVDSRTITYASAGNAVPSKYGQFKAWLVFKLYVVTSYFRGF